MSAEYTGERFLPKDCKGEMEIEHYQRYRFAAAFVEGKKVLDAACGEGYGSSILSEKAKEVTGLDISAETVENANKKYGKENLSFRARHRRDTGKLPEGNTARVKAGRLSYYVNS